MSIQSLIHILNVVTRRNLHFIDFPEQLWAEPSFYKISVSIFKIFIFTFRVGINSKFHDKNSQILLSTYVPRVRLDGYSSMSFSFAASTIWNSLPLNHHKLSSIVPFSPALKTFLTLEQLFIYF